MSARLFCTVECKRIQVGFHRPFATKTSADDVSRKQKGTNEWYIIASPPKVSCSHRQDLTQIYSFIISIRVERVFHQMTHVFNEPQSAGTYLYPPQSSWLTLSNLIGNTLHMNNKTNEQSAFKIMSISGAKYIYQFYGQWFSNSNEITTCKIIF